MSTLDPARRLLLPRTSSSAALHHSALLGWAPCRRRQPVGAQRRHQVGHLNRGDGRLAALVADLAASAVERLRHNAVPAASASMSTRARTPCMQDAVRDTPHREAVRLHERAMWLPPMLPHLLHGVTRQHTKDHRHARVHARVEASAGGSADNGVVMRRGAAHLQTGAAVRQRGQPLAAARIRRCSSAVLRAARHLALLLRLHACVACCDPTVPLAFLTTTPMQTTASKLPDLAIALATTGSSKLPGTQQT